MKKLVPTISLLFLLGASLVRADESPVFPVLAWRGDELLWLERETDAAQLSLEVFVSAQLEGLSPAELDVGLASFFSAETRLGKVVVRGSEARIVLSTPSSPGWGDLPEVLEALSHLLGEWGGRDPAVGRIVLQLNDPHGNAWFSVESATRPPASKPELKEAERMSEGSLETLSAPHAPGQGTAQPLGALSDSSIFLSPGHGWFYSSTLGRWATQRINYHQYIEDHGTAEMVLQYLHQYLWNAGARIYTTRERCLNTNMAIVRQGGPGYSQTGTWTVESTGGAYDGSHRWASTTTGSPTATARFTPTIPEAGHYAVYVWYSRSSSGTTTQDARITVNHTGDSTLWTQDQNRDGFTWKYIGTYYFEEGFNPETGSVVIDNQSNVGGRRVIANAVRFGGGMGDMPDNVSGTISGKPRWEESGRYYAGFLGKSDWASSTQINAMPRWAAWEHEAWEDGKSVYVSWHTNGANGSARGTETIAFTRGGRNDPFAGVPGGDRLRDYIHDQVISTIRTKWDSSWPNRGKITLNLAELNPDHNSKMPAALLEVGFHDNATDTKFLLDPEFRRTVARAVYHGLVEYYYREVPGFTNATFLPEPPQHFRARGSADGTITLDWAAPPFSTGLDALIGHAATGYRVYRSQNGYGFDNGTSVAGTTVTLSGYEPGEVVYLRVTATNAGGESFPTTTLAVRIPENESSRRILVVNGFSRNDRFMNVVENDPHSSIPLQRGYLGRLNTFNYIVPHAKAIEAYPQIVGFDSTEAAAVENAMVSLADYHGVIWMAGLQAHVNDIGTRETPVFWGQLPGRIASYLSGGGKLFISGAEVGFDLNRAGLGGFMQSVLRAGYVQRSAGVHHARGASASIMAELESFQFDDGSGPVYRVENANVIAPANGSVPMLRYPPVQTIEPFDSSSGWLNPMSAPATNAAGATFAIVSSPVVQGSGAGRLTYDWGSGNRIRLHRQTLPPFDADSDLTLWVHGDGSGHQVEIAARDSDNDIFVGPRVTIDWSGWKEVTWNDVRNTGTIWHQGGDGQVTADTLRFDGLFLHRGGSSPNSGAVFFDALTATPTGGGSAPVAGVQYDDAYQVVFMTVPFESIVSDGTRAQMMANVLDFFRFGLSGFEEWLLEFFTEAELEDPEIGGEFAAPAGDGLPNILKFALNLDPREPSRDGLPRLAVEEGLLTFRFNLSKRALAEIEFQIEVSDDLLSWRPGTGEVEIVSTVDQGDVWEIIARDTVPFPENERRFLRLRVSR